MSRMPEAESYSEGEIVSLTAHADNGSKFVRWMNDAKGTDLLTKVEINSAKFVFAELQNQKYFKRKCLRIGFR